MTNDTCQHALITVAFILELVILFNSGNGNSSEGFPAFRSSMGPFQKARTTMPFASSRSVKPSGDCWA